MAQVIADRRDLDFVLYEQLKAEELTQFERYKDFNKKTFDMIITEARNFAVKELLPTCAEGDKVGLRFENGHVKVPECFHRAYELLLEGEWNSLMEDPDWGGQGLPIIISQAAGEYLYGGNWAVTNFGGLGHGTGKMIEIFGTQKQKELFLKKLYTAEWGGTMVLTEPQAGSDVGALNTSAVKNPDGTYSISGNKIFITNGEHDLTENIIHPVLARIDGDPPGTKGISIFIVPKIWVNEDGTLGEPNDITCTGIEEKMGIHASPTCSMALGTKGNCKGLLLGEERQGMKIMFQMMNEARLGVGFQAFCYASTAYLYALSYAKERIQGRALEKGKDPTAPQVPIIQHPDVRRMLLQMKAYVEGMRSFVYFVGQCLEKEILAINADERVYFKGFADLLTPLVKAYCAQRGFDVCVQAVQIFGGYGYIKEYPVEQLVRDCKITSIYEGTDGIQAMDLLGRKLGMLKGQVFINLLAEIQKTTAMARETGQLEELANEVEIAVNRLGEVAMQLGKTAMSPQFNLAFAFAFPFLEVMGDVIMAWMLLWRSALAQQKLAKGAKKKDIDFYEGQIKTAEFFIHCVLPTTLGKMNSILKSNRSPMEISEAAFGG
ncbi:MAG: acyl-CoA dehydrogenase [Desulfobacterales bacterium]|jgi:alkylation response protein AidB-like acyl-CoA dehydrogenase